jgi:hypothetical protein
MAKKVLDQKAKAKKQMKIAIAGGVLFVALLAYQVPKTMAMLNAKPAVSTTAVATTPAPAATPTPGATPTPATPGAAPPAVAAPAASGADLLVVNADLSPAPLDGQLAALTQFTSKDPFRQQVGSTGDATAAPPTSTTAKPPGAVGGGGSFTPGPSTTPASTPAGPAPTVATISVNGVEMAVNVKTDFPLDSPFFSLVSITATTVKIGIAGGSLATGSPTVTLKKGKPLTLMNTADGTRYVLVFISVGDTTTPAAAASATAAPTTTTTTPTTGTPTTPSP